MTNTSVVKVGGSIAKTLPPDTGDIQLLYHCGNHPDSQALRTDPNFRGIAGYVYNLRCKAEILSLPETSHPEVAVTDSQPARTIKYLDTLWRSPRRQLEILFSTNGGSDWMGIAEVALINPQGYPYTSQNLLLNFATDLPLEMAGDAAIGVRAKNVLGKYEDENGEEIIYEGYLASDDKVTIFGGFLEEISLKGGAASSGGESHQPIQTAGLMGMQILEKTGDAKILGQVGLGEGSNGNSTGADFYFPGEIGAFKETMGSIVVGHWVLGSFLRIPCRGNYGPLHSPDDKRLQVLDAWSLETLIDVRVMDVMPAEYNSDAYGGHINIARISTSAYAGRTAALRVVNDVITDSFQFPLSVICPSIMVEV